MGSSEDGCSEDGCGKPVLARGLCGQHYKAWQRAGKPAGPALEAHDAVLCAAAGCDAKLYAKGHCSRHYRQLLRTGDLVPDATPSECAVEGCERRAVTRGWCHGHYVRWNRGGDVRADAPLVREVLDVCVVDGCERGATRVRYCRSHYNRWKLYGDPVLGGPIRLITGDGSLSHGYWMVAVQPHQRHLVPAGRFKELEHRLVMAAALGRPLTAEETVHHVNGDRLDNRLTNLELWNTAQPKGQRVQDKLAYARRLLELYVPDIGVALGWDLDPLTGLPPGWVVDHVTGEARHEKSPTVSTIGLRSR